MARELRQQFATTGVCVVSLVSSPGSRKTALLGETLRRFGRRHRVAALTGDLATDNDAARLRESGAPVRQITTGTVCHLDAEMVHDALAVGTWPSSTSFSLKTLVTWSAQQATT